jgi:hypothetical protein
MAYIEKHLHILAQPPGTWTTLNPLIGYPGVFLAANSSLRHTSSVLAELPINPQASVTISLPVPTIPGVPQYMTTIPYLFAVIFL